MSKPKDPLTKLTQALNKFVDARIELRLAQVSGKAPKDPNDDRGDGPLLRSNVQSAAHVLYEALKAWKESP